MLISVDIEESQESRTLGVVVESCESCEWLRELWEVRTFCLGERRAEKQGSISDGQANAGIGRDWGVPNTV